MDPVKNIFKGMKCYNVDFIVLEIYDRIFSIAKFMIC